MYVGMSFRMTTMTFMYITFCVFLGTKAYQKLKKKTQRKQAQHRAAVETAARINCTSDTFGIYFYGFHCTSELRLFTGCCLRNWRMLDSNTSSDQNI